ncbi:MAG: M23 family metallopeptidase [Pseudomonadota bacterium]|nr:M23 family metallopeptidase [Pseudomonadota bacterium]
MLQFRDTGDLFEENDEAMAAFEPHPARSAAALAVSISVMLAGAAFLIFVMQRAPAPAAAAGEPAVLTENIAPAAAAPQPLSVPAIVDAPEATAVDPEAPIDTRGLAPSLNPARILADETIDTTKGPSLKPKPSLDKEASTPAASPSRLIALGQTFLASDEDGPPPFFPVEELTPSRPSRPPLSVAYAGDVTDGPHTVHVILAKGETFVDALRRAGVRAEDRNSAAYAFGAYQNLRALRPGQEFVLTTAEPNQTLFQLASARQPGEAHLLSLDFRADSENRITVRRAGDGGFEAAKDSVPLTSRLVTISGRINGSLYYSAKSVGAPDEVIAGLADMFAYDVDFQREIFGGDEFEAIFEVKYDDKGRMVGAGDILYGRLKWRGRTKEKGYYLFADYQGGRKNGDYFDAAGQSAKRLLMKTPIDGARLSSGFGTRTHPILGYAKAHKGVDFAAPRGTPIKAAGDGVVERAGPYGSFGNYIKIRHANGYKTAYAHLNSIRKGVRAGARVDQGDIIGYVGTTGRSTGPHLHYEVHYNNVQVNPQNLKIATGVELKGRDLEAFKAVRAHIDAMRMPAEPDSNLVAKKDSAASSL